MKLTFLFALLTLVPGTILSAQPTPAEQFEKYLRDNFSIALPEQELFFLVIPQLGCSYCNKEIAQKWQSRWYPRAYLITSNKTLISRKNLNEDQLKKLLLDEKRLIHRINMRSNYLGIIRTKNGKVIEIRGLSQAEVETFDLSFISD